MVAIRVMFEKLKEEVDSDLGGFAGDLVGILEKNLVSDREWKERLEDLLVVTLKCNNSYVDFSMTFCLRVFKTLTNGNEVE
ncbi:hypothetical protein JHK84_027919 [Glycine max]|nr:hypothetical protein JHK86_027804 [Glycine max]KAG5151447.1 hypothetical protein JHK84_027919 [Glycine max]